jgi:hypothetical protein
MTSTKKETYHPAGCALFIANYLQLYTSDAAISLTNATLARLAAQNKQSALAGLQSGSASRHSDALVEACAVMTGNQPAAIFQQLLAQAGTQANKAKVLGSRHGRNMSWSFKTPDRAREIKIAS